MSKKLLPPLRHKRTRILLLLSSYLDAATFSGDTTGGGEPTSRILARNYDLWSAGSYSDLEHCLTALHLHAPSVHWHTWEGCVKGRWNGPTRNHKAERGVTWLKEVMPSNVFVPAEISENAGYTPSEARTYERSRAKAA